MPMLQRIVQYLRKLIPRGWSPILVFLSSKIKHLQEYPAKMENGETIYLDLSQKMCHGYFYNGRVEHEEFTDIFLEKSLDTGDTFVDVGANVGYFSILAGNIVGGEGQVHSFEPYPKAYSILKMNTEYRDNIKIYDIALSNVKGKSEFSIMDEGDRSSIGTNKNARKVVNIKKNKLDNVLNKGVPKVDVIKIDVEGHELEVMEGAREVIRAYKPIIYFEYTYIYRNNKYNFEEFENFLEEKKYSLKWVEMDNPSEGIIGSEDATYIIAIPESRIEKID